jgi:hypothetical protein
VTVVRRHVTLTRIFPHSAWPHCPRVVWLLGLFHENQPKSVTEHNIDLFSLKANIIVSESLKVLFIILLSCQPCCV